MRSRDDVELAAYSLEADTQTWQRTLTELVARHWEGGVFSFAYDASDPNEVIRERLVAVGVDRAIDLQVAEMVMRGPIDPKWVWPLFRKEPHLIRLLEAVGASGLESSEQRQAQDAGVRCSSRTDLVHLLAAVEGAG